MLKLPNRIARRFLHLVFTSNIAKDPGNGSASMQAKTVLMGVDDGGGDGGGAKFALFLSCVYVFSLAFIYCAHICNG